MFYLNIYINEASFDQLFFEILHLLPSQSISFLLKDVAKFRFWYKANVSKWTYISPELMNLSKFG